MTFRPLTRCVLMAASLCLAALPARALDVETYAGTVTVTGTPSKVAVYDIAALDTLLAIGVMPAGIPGNLYLPELSDLKGKADVVGDIFEPDLEALSALQPDLVIVGGRSSGKEKETSRIAPSLDMTMDGIDVVDQARERARTYGTIFGRKVQADKALADFDAALARARSAVQGKGKALIVMTNGPKITAYGTTSRFGWVHKALDLPAAVEDVKGATHGEPVSFEFIARADPDWLLVLDRAAAIGARDQNAKATLDNALVHGTRAWKRGQVVYLPSADFYIAAGGLKATTRVLGAIETAFSDSQ
ncbi:siderophore ABC transporter substrate-binding protein [Rhizobium straminoryzae]|uniref:Siderophore ABC transporter substrate-binding protein n=1 Tax=Rhizobium straminoryzae TaxID=1387186 RepID=A0A549TFL1_9HYPH|nr:siderophore ABC transporter substrate-binding protein [Rhizobium straminoryzae]TRL41293.1 siderophore ABC transporter substrate-binding protein [Rhizobium straminoryzae]